MVFVWSSQNVSLVLICSGLQSPRGPSLPFHSSTYPHSLRKRDLVSPLAHVPSRWLGCAGKHQGAGRGLAAGLWEDPFGPQALGPGPWDPRSVLQQPVCRRARALKYPSEVGSRLLPVSFMGVGLAEAACIQCIWWVPHPFSRLNLGCSLVATKENFTDGFSAHPVGTPDS